MPISTTTVPAKGRACDDTTGAVLASDLQFAHTHWTRLKGLLGTRRLERGRGLWLKPCNQIHMFAMRYAVDVVFLDAQHRVVHTLPSLAPWKISPRINSAESVLELPSGTLAEVPLARGTRIAIDEPSHAAAARRRGFESVVCNVLLALLFLSFAVAHLHVAVRSGQWATTLPAVGQEALLVVLFLARRRTQSASTNPTDWALGIVGTFLALLLRPGELGPLVAVGRVLQIGGILFAAVAAIFLGRSMGVVAANRGVRTAGPYRWVRHPMYGAYMLAYAGYSLSYPTAWNVIITTIVAAAFVGRAVAEERLLQRDPLYRAYLGRIQWRFLPYVY